MNTGQKIFGADRSRFQLLKQGIGLVLGELVIKVAKPQSLKGIRCFAEIEVVKNAAKIEEYVFYHGSEGKSDAVNINVLWILLSRIVSATTVDSL